MHFGVVGRNINNLIAGFMYGNKSVKQFVWIDFEEKVTSSEF